MVVGQVTGIHLLTAVLALVLVANVNVLPGKTDGMISKANKMQESDYSRQPDSEGDRSHLPLIGFQHLNLSEGKESNSPFPGNYTKWFVGRVEQENIFHRSARQRSI